MNKKIHAQFLLGKIRSGFLALTKDNETFIIEILEQIKDQPEIVTLCGSTRFGPIFHVVNLRETIAGRIVLSIGVDAKSDADLVLTGEITVEDKDRLDQLHLRKVEMADRIVMINGPIGGIPYLGESSLRELAHARSLGKPIEWLNFPTEHTIEGERAWPLGTKK